MIEPNVSHLLQGVSGTLTDPSFLIYFSWAYLANMIGAGVMASIIVHVIKNIAGKGANFPGWLLRLSTFLISSAILLIATYFDSGLLTIEKSVLCLLNGFGAYLVASGGYDNLANFINKVRGTAA